MMYMFTRVKFGWTEMDYSLFSTYAMITNLLGNIRRNMYVCVSYLYILLIVSGTIFSVGVFSHILEIDDALIGVMSCISKILAGFVYAYAPTDFVFYLG
jgi:PCFT/HCP family folate transporter-like MFS transporter 1/3